MAKNKQAQKTNISSMQVIKTLQLLLQSEYSMKDLVDKLNNNETFPIFNNSVISKYINTCRFCDIKIPKINNKYYIAQLPFGLDLSLFETDLIQSVQDYVKHEMSSKSNNIINNLFEKISHFSNKEISRVEKDELLYAIEIFEHAKARKRKVNLIFKNKEHLVCVPKSITYENNKIYFNVYDKKIRNIDVSRLSGVELSGQRYVDTFGGDLVVIFKLKGGLAKRYEARENEKIEQNLDGTITVINRNENKEMLFSRLLRYDDKCEIISPKNYREEMKDLISEMLKNYGVKG